MFPFLNGIVFLRQITDPGRVSLSEKHRLVKMQCNGTINHLSTVGDFFKHVIR